MRGGTNIYPYSDSNSNSNTYSYSYSNTNSNCITYAYTDTDPVHWEMFTHAEAAPNSGTAPVGRLGD